MKERMETLEEKVARVVKEEVAVAPPFYAWFIKRDEAGSRTHHIHMVESWFEHWDRLLFRDYLIERPDIAREYGSLKIKLCGADPNDRVAYTHAKSDFVRRVTETAKRYCHGNTKNEPFDSDVAEALKGRFHEARSCT